MNTKQLKKDLKELNEVCNPTNLAEKMFGSEMFGSEIDYKEKFIEQRKRNNWFIFNFIMRDERVGVKKVEVPQFKSKSEEHNWYLNQINIKL